LRSFQLSFLTMHAELLDVFGLWNLGSIQIDSRTGCGTRGGYDMN